MALSRSRGSSRQRGRDYSAAKALSFDVASRSQSDEEEGGGGKGLNGPTTRRQWSEWVGKSPPSNMGKENQIEVRMGHAQIHRKLKCLQKSFKQN